MVLGIVAGLKNGELVMAGVVEEIVEIRWLPGCQGLIGKCSDFELYSIVNRKPVEVTKSFAC